MWKLPSELPSRSFSPTSSDNSEIPEDLMKLYVNQNLFAYHNKALKESLRKLKMENYKKSLKLKALDEGTFYDLELSPPTFPCKLNDLRFFIENVDPKINEDNLLDHFEAFGDVIDIGINPDRKAFITFRYFYDERPHNGTHNIQDIPLTLESIYKTPDNPTSTVLITGDIENISGDNLRHYFRNTGVIVDFRRTVNRKTKKLSQFVFIKFDSPGSVETVVNFSHNIDNIHLECFAYDEI